MRLSLMKEIERVPALRSQIYDRLRAAIRVGQYPPGTRMLELDVARDLGVSRTPAREAMALLSREGILEHDGRNFRTPVFNAAQVTEVFEIRQRLEPYAVRLACERADADELNSLRILADAGLSESATADEYADANFKLRQVLFSLCKNRRLEASIHLYDDLVHFVRVETLNMETNRAISIKGWRQLIDSVVARKTGVAEEAMTCLLTIAYELLLPVLEEQSNATTEDRGT